MKRLSLAVAAFVLAVLGIQSSTVEAHAAVPIFPSCLRTPLSGGEVRVWFNPGNLYADPSRVVIGTQNDVKVVMAQRRDDVWVAVVQPADDGTYYFKMRSPESTHGAWTKCKKIQP